MAYYAALVSLVQLLKEISHNDRYPNSLLDKQQIASLYEKFNLLQDLLGDYSPKVNLLERRIRDAAYQAQDVIESHIHPENKTHGIQAQDIIKSHIHPEKKTRGVKRFFGHLVSASGKAPRQLKPQIFEGPGLDNARKGYNELEKVKEDVDSILEEMMRIKKSQTTDVEDLPLNSYSANNEVPKHAPGGGNTMVGSDEILTAIKAQLCGESSKLKVVSIVGMGGLGKTTLAKRLFDDKLIEDHFDCHSWATISQDYYMRKILLDIANSLSINKELHGVGVEVLKEYIYKHLKGRKYLVIMDDLWNIKFWDDIKMIFPDDSNGSRVVLTTRLSDVAVYAGGLEFLHQMQFLNEDKSWNLFCEKVFCPPNLQDIGRLIANNCGGLPLAIVVVAGLLSKVNKTRHDWEEIAKNVSSAAIENDEHFSNILSLSYNHLPHHLKPCFLYLGGFPEDYEVPVSKLIRLWVAEGFVRPIESKSLEEVAEEYLEDLVNRNLVLITKKRTNGKFKYCSFHDLLRDLCTQRARYENFLHFLQYNDFHPEALRNVRRLYIYPFSFFPIDQANEYFSHVRSVLFVSYVFDYFLSFASGFKLLRVLDTLYTKFSSFPAEIIELLHLRYLALWIPEFHTPPSISRLQNLQTLIVHGYSSSFPFEIWKMPHLRHVVISEIRLSGIPYDERIIGGVGLLGSLQTLSKVVDFEFTIDTIEMIRSLKKLKVHYTHPPHIGWQKFCLNNLVCLRELETLVIDFVSDKSHVVPVPHQSIAFPLSLKKLSLMGCIFPWKDMTIVGSLPNLQVLKLRRASFVGEEWEPVEGEFPRLKFLLMESLYDLKYWRAENTHFPWLEHLRIGFCRKLEEIPSEIGDIPTLKLIEVGASKLAADSALKIQQEQRDLGNDVLQVRVYDHLRVKVSDVDFQEEIQADWDKIWAEGDAEEHKIIIGDI